MSKKMKLIPYAEYEKLVNREQSTDFFHKTPVLESFRRKEANSADIMKLTELSDDIKLAMFNSVVKGLKEKFETLTSMPVRVEITNSPAPKDKAFEIDNEKSDRNQQLIEVLPATFRGVAKTIMTALEKTDEVNWDKTGQVWLNGIKREEAKIVDFLSYIVRPNLKYAKPPVGANTFLYVMKKLAIPTSIMGVKIRNKLPSMSLAQMKERITPLSRKDDAVFETSIEQPNFQTPGGAAWTPID